MKPLTILHIEWSDGWGGQEMRVIEESRGIAAKGHRVVIVARKQCQILAKAREAGLETRELEMRRSLDLRAMKQLRALIRAEKVDILNTHSSVDSWIGAFARKGTSAKLVRTRHLFAPVGNHPFNFVYKMADAVVTTGEHVRQRLIEVNGLKGEKVVSIPTGVDVDFFSPRAADVEVKRKLGIPDASRVVSIVGILRKIKRHDLFLAAAEILREHDAGLRFVIAGDGPQKENIEKLIAEKKLGDCVVMAGHQSDVRPIFALSDVVVLCSDSEGVPQSVAQALAMARSVVATNVGGVGELVKNGETGLLVAANDTRALAEGVKRFLNDAGFATKCGERGREQVRKNFSKDGMIEQTLELYERLLKTI